jgi:protein O-GlcNAc transferase
LFIGTSQIGRDKSGIAAQNSTFPEIAACKPRLGRFAEKIRFFSLSCLENVDNCSFIAPSIRKGVHVHRPRELTKVDDLFRRACASFNTGNLEDAERLYKKILRAQPKHPGALNLLGVLLTRTDRNEEAERYIRSALDINVRSDATQYNYGIVLKKLKRLPEALKAFNTALALNADVADTWNNRGTVLNDLARFEEALSDFDQAIARKPDFVDAFYNRGNALRNLKRYQAAVESYGKAIRLNPRHSGAYNNRGTVYLKLKLFERALADFDRAIALKPDAAEHYVGRGVVFKHLMQLDKAASAFDKSLAISPGLADAWCGRGSVFRALKRFDVALVAYDRALAIRPDFCEAWLERGDTFIELGRYEDALVSFQKASEISGDLKIVTHVLHTKMLLCDWRGYSDDCAGIVSEIRAGQTVSPFATLSLPCSAEDQFRAAQAEVFPSPPDAVRYRRKASNDRIRIGYFSYDLRSHPVGFLSVGLFEQHDRARFETIAVSFGPDDDSQFRKRIESAFDRFHDVRLQSDQEITELVRDLEIDIAVDLNGFTTGARTQILACRPAPIQVNFLGYPGTMGADYYDYIIADRLIIPPDQQRFYSEKVVYLPYTYQPNDDKRVISDLVLSRAEAGLPAHGFTFCAFNNSYKLNPSIFDVWMRLLREIEGSVLWLPEVNAAVPANLRREADRRGVLPDRLVFAPRMKKLEDHLARYRLADLFLDTLPYNAHATASDALWAGLPVLTCLGATFAGRVAGSLLSAIGLPELITHSLEEYEELALRLARNPSVLAGFKARLAECRLTAPLFNTTQFTRHIESAYMTMWERYQRRETPVSFGVES